jgi:class 3 adenylate cyclase
MLVCSSCGRENESTFRFCPGCGHELVERSGSKRRQLATLLFCDISGSTAMGERIDAESVREMMFQYFHAMRGAIERHGGTVEKFVGDAVMAVFGVPEAHEDDPLRAVRASWQMQQVMDALNDEFERRFGSRLALRIGVNTGEVIAGSSTSRQAIVTGDAVNVAARLEQAAAPGEILLGDQTYGLVRGAVAVEPVEPLALKGKAEPVTAHRLVALKARADARFRPLDAPLVGRDRELTQLRVSFERVADTGHGLLVLVTGMPGIGKSRLARELLRSLNAHALSGRCLSYGEGITYWPLAEAVKQAATIIEDDSPASARAKLGRLLQGEEHGALVAERVAQALGLASGSAPADEVAWAFRLLVQSIARQRPLVLVLDDLQWAEPALLDLIEGFASLEAPLLVLGLARPELFETRPEWLDQALRLKPLSGSQSDALVEQLLAGSRLLSEGRARVVAAAGGNPLFVEELLALMVEDPSGEIPPSLELLLAARLERLSPDERHAAQRGAIEGQVFHRGAVIELSERRSRHKVGPALDHLAVRDLVRPAQASFADDAAFAFRHILIRDAAYLAMLKKLRAELHERLADWLERVAGKRVTEYEEILGYHLERAYRYREELGPVDRYVVLAGRAASWLGSAGKRAARRGDAIAAAKLLERAVALLDDDAPARVELLLALGETRWARFDASGATVPLEAAAQAAQTAGRLDLQASAELTLAAIGTHMNRGAGEEQSRRAAERWLPVLEELGNERGLAKALFALGMYDASRQRFANAVDRFERALTYARQAQAFQDELECAFWLTISVVAGPEPVDEALRRLGSLADKATTLATRATVLERLGTLHALTDDAVTARELIAEAKQLYDELGLQRQLVYLRFFTSGQLAELEADVDEAVRLYREGCALLESIGETGALSTLQARLAYALGSVGLYEEAEELTLRSEELGDPDDLITQSSWRTARARAIAHRGRLSDAERLAREAFSLAGDNIAARGEALETLSETLALAERRAEAAAEARRAKEIYEQKGDRPSARRASATLDRLTEQAAPSA